jgi:hypothetical protein
MRSLAVAVALLAGCDHVFDLAHVTDDDGGGAATFLHRKKISLVSPTAAVLADLPAGILLRQDADLVAGALTDRDFQFTAADGMTRLDHEVEHYDRARGDLTAWVRIPELVGITEIYLYYGGPVVPSSPTTWRTEYGAVWHMSSTTGDQFDSTTFANTLSAESPAAVPEVVDGPLGNALRFDGVVDSLRALDAPSLNAGTTSFSYSIWVNVTTPAGAYDQPLRKGGGNAPNPGYDFELGTGTWWAGVADGTTIAYAGFDSTSDLLDRWIQLTAVLDRSAGEVRVYTNAILRDTRPLPVGSLTSTNNALLVSFPQADDWFRGMLDEIRLYHGALDPAWIQTEYRNIADPTSFVVVGREEDL